MMKSVNLLWLVLTVAVAGALFRVSYRVQHLEHHLVGINKQIAQEEESIRVLQAEWSYLNDPSRLEALAKKHLDLHPTSPGQIVTLDQVPNKLPAVLASAPSPRQGKASPAPTVKPIMATYTRHATDD